MDQQLIYTCCPFLGEWSLDEGHRIFYVCLLCILHVYIFGTQSNMHAALFPGEFRKLLAAFVSGSTAKSGGIIRKITPTSAELRDAPTANRSQQKLQVSQREMKICEMAFSELFVCKYFIPITFM